MRQPSEPFLAYVHRVNTEFAEVFGDRLQGNKTSFKIRVPSRYRQRGGTWPLGRTAPAPENNSRDNPSLSWSPQSSQPGVVGVLDWDPPTRNP